MLPQIAITEVEDNVEFKCMIKSIKTDDDDGYGVGWTFSGSPRIKNYKVTRGLAFTSVEIEDVKPSNEGYYECSGFVEDIPFIARGKLVIRGEKIVFQSEELL